MTNQTIRAMESVLAKIGETLDVKPGDVPALLERVESVARTDRVAYAAFSVLSNIIATAVVGGTAEELSDIAAEFIAPLAPITDSDMEWARQQINLVTPHDGHGHDQ